MEVTEEGMVTEAREVQPQKAFCPMVVTEEGIVTWPFASGWNTHCGACPIEALGSASHTSAASSQPRRNALPLLCRCVVGLDSLEERRDAPTRNSL